MNLYFNFRTFFRLLYFDCKGETAAYRSECDEWVHVPVYCCFNRRIYPNIPPLSLSRCLSLSLSLSHIHDTTQSLDSNSVFYFDLNCHVVYLLQRSPNSSACFILAPHSWGFEVTYSDAPQSVGLPWTRGQLVTESSAWQHTQHSQQTSMPPVGFEPSMPAGERP